MGYGYGRNASGREALACDGCGTVGGVRKRTCPHKVLGDTSRSATRYALAYCPAPALCAACWERHGKNAVHDQCKAGAAASQREADASQARLDAGELVLVAGYGSWDDRVPDGCSGALFRNGEREVFVTMPSETYAERGAHSFLADFPAELVTLVSDNGKPVAPPWQPPTAHAKVADGAVLRFEHAMDFGARYGTHTRFRAHKEGRAWRFTALSESDAALFRCRITRWQHRAYTVEASA